MIVQMLSIPTFQLCDIFLRAQFAICAVGGQPCAYLMDSHVHIYWAAMCLFTGQPCSHLLDSHMHTYWTAMCIFTGQPCSYKTAFIWTLFYLTTVAGHFPSAPLTYKFSKCCEQFVC